MFKGITDILKTSASGEFEIGRVSLAIGGLFAVLSPIGFEVYEVGWNGGHFNVTEWCVAYPSGIALLVSSGVLSIGAKQKQIAQAQSIAPPSTGAGS